MALKGVKVLEMAGLAPAPFCGMILADFGADVIRIDRPNTFDGDRLSRGKKSICLDLTKKEGANVVRVLSAKADVLIDPFRPGILEKFGLGPKDLSPKLIYARLSGYGQSGPMSKMAGHDINYVAVSGLLSKLGQYGSHPSPPINLLADFAGGGLLCALGICMALLHKLKTGEGQVIDNSMTEGAAYVGSFIWRTALGKTMPIPLWGEPRGKNVLDGGVAFYQTYKTKDNKYVAVGALEPKFYSNLLKGLGLKADEYQQFSDQEVLRQTFTKHFASKTQAEWDEIFKHIDACVTPVLEMEEAAHYSQHVERDAFAIIGDKETCPKPTPRMSKSHFNINLKEPIVGEHSVEILKGAGYSESDILALLKDEVITIPFESKL